MVLSSLFFSIKNLKELVRKAMQRYLRVLKESNKSTFDSFSRQEPCTDHIPYYLSGLSRAFSDNLSRNSCIARTRDVSSKINNMYQVIVPPISKAIYYKRVGFVSLIRLANFLHANLSLI